MGTHLGIRSRIGPSIALIGAAVVFFGVFVPAQAAPSKGGGSGGGRGKRDTTAPVVSIATPAAGTAVSGTVGVSGSASDAGGIVTVAVRFDDGAPVTAAGTSSWTASLDSGSLANGTHTVTASATDASGNTGSASVAISVNNPAPSPSPTPTPTPPPPSGSPVPAPTLAPGSIGGWTFQDLDRDGIYESNEMPLASQHLYLYSGSGAYLGNTYSDASGWYQFTGRADGTYTVGYAAASWWELRRDWVPDTTGSILPQYSVQLGGTARADFGWRAIVRSTDVNVPLSSFTGPSGIVVQSYDDVVDAVTVHDALMQGSMVGEEAATVTVRFDYGTTGSAATMAVQSNGRYVSFNATAYIPYESWLDSGDRTLFHEYGHAWSLYFAYMVQQDPGMASYLEARGLSGDPRVGTSYAWDVKELIAEDYRQLFGTANAAAGGQINGEIPPAATVPGLKDFLSVAFRDLPA